MDAGFVYATDVTENVRVTQTIPDSLHTSIIYTAAVLNKSRNPEMAAKFVQFVAESDETMIKYGFMSIRDVPHGS